MEFVTCLLVVRFIGPVTVVHEAAQVAKLINECIPANASVMKGSPKRREGLQLRDVVGNVPHAYIDEYEH